MSARQVRSAAGPLAAVVVGVLAFGAGSEIRAQRASDARAAARASSRVTVRYAPSLTSRASMRAR